MKMLITYTYRKDGNSLGFADKDVESTDGKLTSTVRLTIRSMSAFPIQIEA